MKSVFTLSLIFITVSCHAITFEGHVVGVSDGDTITVLDARKVQHKIRLSGIDAPEKKQPFGQRSKESLSDLVFNKPVSVESYKRDRYGREISKVVVGGVEANLMQVQLGFAWHYKAYDREQSTTDRKIYADAENEARISKRGLWIDSDAISPWNFRHKK